jgi:predicted nucleotidyltransferase component of viral defense system
VFKQIRVTPKEIILSQKLWTITQRSRAKGRDFYDIIYLLQNTKPDVGFLNLKFGTSNWDEAREKILEGIEGIDLDSMVKDVQPFLINKKEGKKIKLFRDYMKQIEFD